MSFKPLVLAEDLDAVLEARQDMLDGRAVLYPECRRLKKLAATSDSQALKDAAHHYLDRADMVLATSFDRVHLEAQIRHRTATQKGDPAGIQEILDGVLERLGQALTELSASKQAVEDALADLE